MDVKVFYVAPEVNIVELKSEGVLCASQRDGQIDQLEFKYDWSDMWNN